MNTAQYNDLILYATKMCYAEQGNTIIEPSDLVAEAFVELSEHAGKPEFMQMMRKTVKRLFRSNGEGRTTTYTDNGQTKRVSICKKCRTSKGESQYYLYIDRATGQKTCIPPYCKMCIKEYLYHHYRTPQGMKQNKARFKKYVDNNREKWNSYLRERFKKDKESLSDSYIKKMLKAQLKKQGLSEDLSDVMIEEKRIELTRKRIGASLN